MYTGGFPGYTYSFLGTLESSDDGGTFYYNSDDLRNASWSVPVSAVVPVSTSTLKDITLYLSDAVGNVIELKRSVYVDYSAPEITISDPPMYGNSWVNPQTPVIKGTATDDIGVDSVLLVVKDEISGRYWNGSDWQAALDVIPVPTQSGRTVAWEYSGLTKENLRSSDYKIVAYARDLVGRQGQAQSTVGYKKRIDLGKMDFTGYTINVNEVKNIARAEAVDSFLTKTGEDIVGMSATILPYRMSALLSPYVKWSVVGANNASGNPFSTLAGNPSRFYTRIPPIPAAPKAYRGPLAYTVFPRLEYNYAGENVTCLSQDHETISQDNLDTLRQEYYDVGTLRGVPERAMFDQESAAPYSGLLGAASGTYGWHIIKILKAHVKSLADSLASNEEYGNVALNVISGYRTPKLNGGSKTSNHMYGEAFDYDQDSSIDFWNVYVLAYNNFSPHENYLYSPNGCIVDLSDYSSMPTLPKTMSVACKSTRGVYDDYKLEKITAFSSGHISWR